MKLSTILPVLNWAPQIDRRTAAADLSAGLTGALVVLPQSVAFATIAGMPPEYGLYAGMIPAIVAALFGSSWHLVSGPTTAASIVLFSSLSGYAEPGSARYVQLALTLALMVGLIELTLGLLKLGVVVNFISHAVIVGFTAGAGILIGASQAKNFFGVAVPRGARFHEIIIYVVVHWSQIVPSIAIVSTITLAIGVLTRRFAPRAPYMIVAILGGSAVAALLKVFSGAAVPTVGALRSSLPPLSAPSFDPQVWQMLGSTALAVTLFALTEAISIARALAVHSGQEIDANQEFIGQGLSNVAGSFFSSYVATGSFNRSAVNYAAGARTPLAAALAGLFLMLAVPFVAPLAAYLPYAAMAGILMQVAWSLVDRRHIARIIRTSRGETVVMALTFVATLTLDLEDAILAGVVLSLLLYVSRTSNPRLSPRVPDPLNPARKFTSPRPSLPECPQFKIVRLNGSLFFGAVANFSRAVRAIEARAPRAKNVLLLMSSVNFIDTGGAEALLAAANRFRERGGGLYLARVKEEVRDLLDRGHYTEEIGVDRFFATKTAALRTIYRELDCDFCRDCKLNVFLECVQTNGADDGGADKSQSRPDASVRLDRSPVA